MEGKRLLPVKAKGIHNGCQLFGILNLKDLLAALALPCLAVEAKAKGLLEELPEQRRKLSALCDNLYGIIAKGIAEKQNPKAFCQCAACRLGDIFTDFRFCRRRKRPHGTHLSVYQILISGSRRMPEF